MTPVRGLALYAAMSLGLAACTKTVPVDPPLLAHAELGCENDEFKMFTWPDGAPGVMLDIGVAASGCNTSFVALSPNWQLNTSDWVEVQFLRKDNKAFPWMWQSAGGQQKSGAPIVSTGLPLLDMLGFGGGNVPVVAVRFRNNGERSGHRQVRAWIRDQVAMQPGSRQVLDPMMTAIFVGAILLVVGLYFRQSVGEGMWQAAALVMVLFKGYPRPPRRTPMADDTGETPPSAHPPEIEQAFALLGRYDPRITLPSPTSPLEVYDGVLATLEESGALLLVTQRNKVALRLQVQVKEYLTNAIAVKRLAEELAKENPKGQRGSRLDKEAYLAHLDLDLQIQEKLNALEAAKQKRTQAPPQGGASQSLTQDILEVLTRYGQQLSTDSPLREEVQGAIDWGKALLIIEEIETKHGPEVFDIDEVRLLLKKAHVPIDQLRPKRST